MATVADVANLAGVSVATVSRVIRNSNKVSDDKREKVEQAIRELGYKTNPETGKRLRKKTLYLICGGSQDEFVDSIMETAAEFGYDIAVDFTVGRALEVNTFIKKLLKYHIINGVITCGLPPASADALKEIDRSVPVVQCMDEVLTENSFVVSSDDVMMGHDAVLHLAGKGCRRIAFIGLGAMKEVFRYSSLREMGYRMAHAEKGIVPDESLIVQCSQNPESVEKAVDKLLKLKDRPDAIFCVRDSVAVTVVNQLTRRGVRVPDDIMVMGCGSAEGAEQCFLKLSNVTQLYYEIGLEAIKMIDARITGKTENGRRLNIRHMVVDRETTK